MYSSQGSDSVPRSPSSPTTLPFPETSVWFTLKLLVLSFLLENCDVDADTLEIVWEHFQDLEQVDQLKRCMIADISSRSEFPPLFAIIHSFTPEVLSILSSITDEQDLKKTEGSEDFAYESYFSSHSYDFGFFHNYGKRSLMSARFIPFSQCSGSDQCSYCDMVIPVMDAISHLETGLPFPFTDTDWCRLLELERGSDGDEEAYVWKELGHSLRQHTVAAQATIIGKDCFLNEDTVAEATQSVQEPHALKQMIEENNLFPDIFKLSDDPRTLERLLDRAYGYLMQQSPLTAELWIRSHFSSALESKLDVLDNHTSPSINLYLSNNSSPVTLNSPPYLGILVESLSPSTGSEVSVGTPCQYSDFLEEDNNKRIHLQEANSVASL